MRIPFLRRFRRTTIADLDERLAGMEQVFLAPPLTPKLATAINLISPHLKLTTSEQDRLLWQADQNGACWGEYEALTPLFNSMPKPKKVLEIGPGMGRSLVFFSKKLKLGLDSLHAYEGNGTTTHYQLQGERSDHTFCGNIRWLKHVLIHNGVRVKVFDAGETHLTDLPGPYDFIYSFYSVGFHWSLEHFLDDILVLMHDRSVAVFTVPQDFVPFQRLNSCQYQIINWTPAWPKNHQLNLLVINGRGPA